MRNYYVEGQWNAICDRCGFKRKSGQLRKEWTGLMVCADTCWEPRHPQTLIKVPKDDPTTEWTRPMQDNSYYTVDWTAVGSGINSVSAPWTTSPAAAGISPRKLGDVNNDGRVNSSDSLAVLRYSTGAAGNSNQTNTYCAWLGEFLISDPTTYSAFLILNTYSS